MIEGIFVLIVLTIALSVPVIAITKIICNILNYYHKKKHQHKMFKELKEGDYIWKLCGDYIEPMRITEVRYYFDKQDDIQEIYISTSDWTTLHLKPQQTNTFKIKEGTVEYYTIFVEAETKRQLTEMKRNKSINEYSVVNKEDKINALNKEINELEQLKEDTINKLQIKL
jgi:hypothetical protein